MDPMTSDAGHVAADGVAHLQAAALEMVAAARTFLDAVEDVVADDERMGRVVDGIADVVRQATDAVAQVGRRGPEGHETRVRHIVVE